VTFQDIPRSATHRTADHGPESRALSAWAELDAFVLLAEPGAGKSRAFEFEAEASGGVYIKARSFANLGPPAGWQGETLFIDGFDEMRADSAERHGPLDVLIRRLAESGRPRFRLSCREADWLAAIDHEALREVAPGGQLEALCLDPLNDEEVTELLRRRPERVPDPAKFRDEAERRGLDGLLRNPLLLEMLVDAVGDDWPRGRADVYQRACERMAVEHNLTIQAARASKTPARDQLLDDAGLLCAVLLFAGMDALVVDGNVETRAEAGIQSIPAALGLADARAALASKLFVAEGRRRLPRHRSIAEYLAAQSIGRRVTAGGLPISRVLALMSGFDGGIVEPLRGLNAWLALTCPLQRAIVIDRDPLACVLYGDVHAFGVDDKRRVLDGLRREAEKFAWFRRGSWVAHPFGALGTADMAIEIAAQLSSADRSVEHQSLLDCVLDAVQHGERLPSLLFMLEAVFEDSSYLEEIRSSALSAWLAQTSDLSRARRWLDAIRDGTLLDPERYLEGQLVDALYPKVLGPVELTAYLDISEPHHFSGRYRLFWNFSVLERTPKAARPVLADALVALNLPKDLLHTHYDLQRVIAKVIGAALDAEGPSVDVARAASWLAMGLDEYSTVALTGDDTKEVRSWLESNGKFQKALVGYGYARTELDTEIGRFPFWISEESLYHARRPRDWYRWLLALGAEAETQPLVEYCFQSSADAVLQQSSDFDIDAEDVERWAELNADRWPQASQWLENAWSCRIDDRRGASYRRRAEQQKTQAEEHAQRHKEWLENLSEIETGSAPAENMHTLAMVHLGHVLDIRGDTPEERLSALIGGGADEVMRAIAGLEATLARGDLPTVEEILELGFKGQYHYLRPASLLAADLVQINDPNAPLAWTDDLARRLIAFRLTNASGDPSDWYTFLIQHRPKVVAEVLEAYARQGLKSFAEHCVTGLWPLAREDSLAELARLVVPKLLRDFPVRPRTAQLRCLNTELLPAALRHVPEDELRTIVSARLAMDKIGSAQRMAWLLVGLRFAAHQRSRQLFELVGMSRARALRLAATLSAQSDHAKGLPPLPAAAIARLVEKMAPLTTPDYAPGGGRVGRRGRLRDLVRGLVDQLAALDSEEATAELDRMRKLPFLSAWKTVFDAALFEHVRLIRSARFSHASAESVARSLSGQAPANALDLAALVRLHLQGLQAHLRGDDTNGLLAFWRDPADDGRWPRTENQCRDALLSLRTPLAAMQEAAQANEGRADLRAETMVAGHRRVVPIEIKKEDHPGLWTAWRDQLERRYMTDPAAEGVGIYLVLWFGHQPRADAQGVVPASAKQLEERLTELIPREDRLRLQVCVLDVSLDVGRPARKKSARRHSRA